MTGRRSRTRKPERRRRESPDRLNLKSESRTPKSEDQRQRAWIGDAVLSLYARSWILRETSGMDGEVLALLTSNEFLATIGNPTAVEAAIGALYESEGLEAAFAWIEREIMPRYEAQRKRRSRQRSA